MKKMTYIFTIMILSLFFHSVKASEKAVDQVTLSGLVNAGYVVTMGELTGAGSKIPLSRVQGFISRDEVIHKNEIENIVVKAGSAAPAVVADVKKIVLPQQEIASRDIIGFFTK